MIIGQAIFQLAVTFTLHFGGKQIFGYEVVPGVEGGGPEMEQLKTIVFNTFVWMQIFNEFKYVNPPLPPFSSSQDTMTDTMKQSPPRQQI